MHNKSSGTKIFDNKTVLATNVWLTDYFFQIKRKEIKLSPTQWKRDLFAKNFIYIYIYFIIIPYGYKENLGVGEVGKYPEFI